MKSFLLFFVTLFFSLIFAQGKPYAGPEDPAGDPSAEREGYMTVIGCFFILKTQQSFPIGQQQTHQGGQIITMV